ncbi:MAG: WecB/TagA/CpsF family glycosyltransferase [Clostridia bacterium]|nr:WecB/TagA/CpsF family glycosyltransferase [Clostridia bacterium]
MNEMSHVGRIYIHGVGVDRLSFDGARERVCSLLSEPCDCPAAVFTPNAEMIYRAARDGRLAALLNSGDINTADGIGTVWAARRLGTPLSGRVAGIELGEAALRFAAERGLRVFLLGGKPAQGDLPGVADRAAARLRDRFPTLNICGTHHGYFESNSAEEQALLERIRATSPHLLVVCLGFPRQERWIMENRDELGCVRVAMALGGSLDVWSGSVRRAPAMIRAAHLEWAWRILRDPRRLKRAAALPAFVGLTIKTARSDRRRLADARK